MNRRQRILALETEMDRLKERLDVMDRQIGGDQDAWWRITTNLPETVAEVTVDKVLAEARQTALALATVIKTLDALENEREQSPGKPAADPADEVKRKREEKLAEARKKAEAGAL